MRPLWTSVALLLASLLHVEGYTCPSGKSKETITLGVGESVDFSTQETETYGKNVKCVVKFKRGKRSKCKLNFSCSAFTLTAKNSACNKGSDFVKIGREKFCEDNSPDVTVNGRTLNVLFRSNKRSKGGEGAECTASCIDTEEVSTTPASTEVPATTPSPATTAAPTTGTTSEYQSLCRDGIQSYPSSMPNSDYYTRLCTTGRGLRIVSAGLTSNESLERTAFILDKVTEGVTDEVINSLNAWDFRHAVMASYPAELTTDIPEHSFLDSDFWDERARGLGATTWVPVGSSAEENLLCEPEDRYLGEDITIHEFAHSLMLLGFTQVDSSFDSELTTLYDAAKSAGSWGASHYAMTNYEEYFAEGVQSHFDANQAASGAPTSLQQLKEVDPDLHSFLSRFFGNSPWSRTCP